MVHFWTAFWANEIYTNNPNTNNPNTNNPNTNNPNTNIFNQYVIYTVPPKFESFFEANG